MGLGTAAMVGSGEELVLRDLKPGEHVISLIAVDADGNSAMRSITVLVGHRVSLALVVKPAGQ
jgi:hypothetical protein